MNGHCAPTDCYSANIDVTQSPNANSLSAHKMDNKRFADRASAKDKNTQSLRMTNGLSICRFTNYYPQKFKSKRYLQLFLLANKVR